MNLKLLVIGLALLAGCGEQSLDSQIKEDIFPTGGFGRLVVEGSEIPEPLKQQYQIKVTRDSYVAIEKLPINHEAQLDSKFKYCVEIVSMTNFSTRLCDIEIQPGKVTILSTGFVSINWDRTPLTVDFGPKAHYALSGNSQKIKIQGSTNMEKADIPSAPLLLFAEDITASYMHVGALAAVKTQHTVLAKNTTKFDITPPDLRNEIQVHLPVAKYPEPKVNSAVVSYAILAHRIGESYLTPDTIISSNGEYHSHGPSHKREIFSWKKLPLYTINRIENISYFMYPLVEGVDQGYYEMRVSHISTRFNKSSKFEIEPLNVGKINGDISGYYKVKRIHGNGTEEPLKWWNYSSGYFLGDTDNPYLYGLGHYLPTETSFFVLKGFKYQVDAYMYDDANVLVKQSSHVLNY